MARPACPRRCCCSSPLADPPSPKMAGEGLQPRPPFPEIAGLPTASRRQQGFALRTVSSSKPPGSLRVSVVAWGRVEARSPRKPPATPVQASRPALHLAPRLFQRPGGWSRVLPERAWRRIWRCRAGDLPFCLDFPRGVLPGVAGTSEGGSRSTFGFAEPEASPGTREKGGSPQP